MEEESFWALTPGQLYLLIRRHNQKEEAYTMMADRRSAQICAILANIHRDTKKQPQPYELKDFMPEFKKSAPKKVQTREEQVETLMAIFGKGK